MSIHGLRQFAAPVRPCLGHQHRLGHRRVAARAHQDLEHRVKRAVSDAPPAMIGLISSAISPKYALESRISWDFIQLTLPFSVLISPLWASMRKGCASHHCGKVLVE
jgi:hypothetical protein